MKKFKIILLSVLIVGVLFSFTACNFFGGTPNTVDQAWANYEKLTYNVYDNDTNIGTLILTMTNSLTEDEKKNGETTKLTVNLDTKNHNVQSTYYGNIYNVISYTKTFTDKNDNKNNYEVEASHGGDYLYYTLTYPNNPSKNADDKKIKVKSPYSDGEYMYYFLRCYNATTSFQTVDVLTNTTHKFSTAAIKETVKTDFNSFGTVECSGYRIYLNETPSGASITVLYTPDSVAYKLSHSSSILSSVKFPTKIQENNIKYILKDASVTPEE
ncbi:MAG: hypothetical protein K5765_07915 [Clostridia bacterium]|nr:hypothetical protein [Clostridia bacterium]